MVPGASALFLAQSSTPVHHAAPPTTCMASVSALRACASCLACVTQRSADDSASAHASNARVGAAAALTPAPVPSAPWALVSAGVSQACEFDRAAASLEAMAT